jgi:hypothetical protein
MEDSIKILLKGVKMGLFSRKNKEKRDINQQTADFINRR